MPQYISPAGRQKLLDELDERVNRIRPDIAMKISEARALGDLSENAEFQSGKELQAFNEGRIEEIQGILKDAEVVTGHKAASVVSLGSTIIVSIANKECEFTIVGASESAPEKGFISNESPLGQAFIGHSAGDEVAVQTPSGTHKYKLLEVK